MPTSSQARLQGRESNPHVEGAEASELADVNIVGPLVNRHSACVGSEGTLISPCRRYTAHHPSLHVPRINLQSGVADYFINSGLLSSCDRDYIAARARYDFQRYHRAAPVRGSAVNISNNWPNVPNDTKRSATHVPTIPAPPQGTSKGTKEPTTKKKISATHRRKSFKAKHPARQSAEEIEESEESESRSRSRSFTFEVDLLKKKSYGSNEESGDLPEAEVEEEEAQAETAEPAAKTDETDETETQPEPAIKDDSVDPDVPARPAKPTMKSLFRQLLTIGVMSNAFRGFAVKSATGEKHEATDNEAEAALNSMVSGLVEGEEEEEEEEDEEVELVMGSLLSDVGSRMEVHKEPEEAEPKPAPKPKPTPKPAAKPPAARPAPGSPKPEAKAAPAPAAAPAASAWKTTGTSEVEQLLADTALPAAEEEEPPKEDATKAFLREVVAGNAFKTGKTAQAAKVVEEKPKKKVFKIPPIRLRRAIPPADPDFLAIRTPNVELTHEQTKNMLEAQLGNIVCLQNEPEYLQHGDVPLAVRVMWIFKMEDTSVNNYTRICLDGILDYEGETLRIRRRDDIFTEEHRAFLLVKQIKEEQAKRMKNKNKKPKISTAVKARSPVS